MNLPDLTLLYASEAEAQAAAARFEESEWNREVDHRRYYACTAWPLDGWKVAIRPFIPGTCT